MMSLFDLVVIILLVVLVPVLLAWLVKKLGIE